MLGMLMVVLDLWNNDKGTVGPTKVVSLMFHVTAEPPQIADSCNLVHPLFAFAQFSSYTASAATASCCMLIAPLYGLLREDDPKTVTTQH